MPVSNLEILEELKDELVKHPDVVIRIVSDEAFEKRTSNTVLESK